MAEQEKKRRQSMLYTWKGETHSIGEWAKITGLKGSTIYTRISRKGWTIEKALTEPIEQKHSHGEKRGPKERKVKRRMEMPLQSEWIPLTPEMLDDTVETIESKREKLYARDEALRADAAAFKALRKAVKKGYIPQRDHGHCEPVRCSSGMRFGW